MELDDVIDAMIADRVIHRHRRKWLVLIATVVVLALVILALGGWKEYQGRKIPTLEAPASIDAGRFQLEITGAKIIHRPKTTNTEGKSRVEVELDIRNIDDEEKTSNSMSGDMLRLVTPGEILKSNGATCNGDLGYKLVYGLPAVHCTSKFDVPAGFSTTVLEVGVVGEVHKASDVLGSTDDPFWQDGKALAVVRITATQETETG